MSFYLAEIRELRKNFMESYKDGDFKKALFLGKYLLDIYKETGDMEHPGLAEDTHNVGVIFDELGLYDKAAEYYRQAAALKKVRFGESATFADTLNNLAIAYNNLGLHEEALKTHVRVLEVREKKLGREHIDYIHSLYNLGNTYEALKQYEKALESHRKALEKSRKCKTLKMMDVADIHASMARSFEKVGNYKKTIYYYEFALDIIEKRIGSRSLPYIINALSLAFVCEKSEFTGLAVEYFERAVDIRRKMFPEGQIDYVNNLNYLADLCLKDGQTEKSLQLHKTALELVEQEFEQTHLLYMDILDRIALDHCALQDFKGALEFSQKALELRKTTAPEDGIEITKSYITLGEISIQMNNCMQALIYYKKALDILGEDSGENASIIDDIWCKIAQLFDHQGVYEAAAFLYETVLKRKRALSTFNREDEIMLMRALAQTRRKQEEYMKAVVICLEMEIAAKELFGKEHFKYAEVLKQLGVAYGKSGDLVAASKCLEEALMIQKETLDEDNPIYIKTLVTFGQVCFYRGNCTRAIQLFKERNDVNFEETAEEQREAACTLLAIGNCYLKFGDRERAEAYLTEAEGKIIRSRLVPNEKYNRLKEIYAEAKNGKFSFIRQQRRRMLDGERKCLEETVIFMTRFYHENINKDRGERVRRAFAAFSLGEMCQRLGKKEEAVYWYILAEKQAEPEYYVRTCTRLGEAYLLYGEEEKAFQKFINAKEYIGEYGDKNTLEYCRILGYIGDYFYRKGSKEMALSFYLLWKQIYKELSLPDCPYYNERLEKVAKILEALEKYKEALELYYVLSVSVRNREGETTKYGKLLLRGASLHIHLGHTKEAETLLDHVLVLAGKNGITTESFGKLCDKVGRLYNLAGLNEKALEALKLAYQESLDGKKCITKEGVQLLCELLWKMGDNQAYFSVKNGCEIE
ncbi:tetratricopeptide repeat protein [Anaerotignum sp.]|uniref:tetratricopeptide repeat protein n=1 Tax=Anaerotignum sp. TaxID=2039241 RepID=UPI0027152AE4|nr:tetratricopeptide repeat protein [Anaerotignum sp.]